MTTSRSDRTTMFAWRATDFGRLRKVPPFEAARWRHQRRRIATARRRDWTREEIDRLVDLLDAGLGYDAIAARLGRTPTAIRIKVTRLDCRMLRRSTVLTARDVARLLGKGCSKSVTRWIALGWLTASASECNGTRIWRIRWDDLMMFLRTRRTWPAWEVDRVTDPDLRAELQALRADDGPWLTPGEVARRLGVTDSAVSQWVRKGFIPAVRYGNWHINARDLEGFVPPCERSKAGIPRGMGRRVVGKTAIEARVL